MAVGRPTKFTPGRIAVILSHIRGGTTRVASCAIADIDRHTLQEWEKADPPLLLPEDIKLPALGSDAADAVDDVYEKGTPFPAALARAESEAEAFFVERIRKAGTESAKVTYVYDRQGTLLREVHEYDWRAAAWLLDHNPKHRANWLPKTGIELSGPDGAPVSVDGHQTVVFQPSPEYLAALGKQAAEHDQQAQGEDAEADA